MRLPQQLPVAPLWSVYDYPRPMRLRSKGAAGGRATVETKTVPPDEMWFLDRITVSCDSTAGTVLQLYANTEDPAELLDGTGSGNAAIADEFAPIQLVNGETVLFVWQGASNGAIGTARIQYRIFRQHVAAS